MFNESHTFVIAELAQTHEGSVELAKLLVKAVAESNADAVKFHTFTSEELAVPSYKHYQLFQQLEWPEHVWKELIDLGHAHGLKVFADIFGNDSVHMLTRNGIDGLKIHGTDMRNPRLLKCLAEVELPLLLSIGGGSIDEARAALSILSSKNVQRPVVLMHGFQSYPTLVEHTNLNKMRYFKDQLNIPVGFADHIDGDHRLNFALCAAAVAMGAVVIEKHITLSRSLKMEDYESALSPDEFVQFMSKVRDLDSAMGSYSEDIPAVEADYRKTTRKHVVAAVPLSTGQMIRDEDVTLRRADSDKEPSDLVDVVGKKADRTYNTNDIILATNLMHLEGEE